MRERGERLAAGLAGIGVAKGDRVAVELPNWTEFLPTAVALGRLGAVLVPIMPIYRTDEVGYVMCHSGAEVAITCEEFKGFRYADMFAALRESLPELVSLVAVRAADAGRAVRFEDLTTTSVGNLGGLPSPDDPFLILYTSGTTSRPKGCFHTFNTVRARAVSRRSASCRSPSSPPRTGPRRVAVSHWRWPPISGSPRPP
ncbi:MAG TPA: AMP-binding protein [Amycolatopsis sp.]|nr:AMP-binding protein [Amycolatopsis sp.]HVV08329.1 AMP-binding protein [Amycolatopsis sp.]